jgi:hypothetical protein
VLLAAMTCLVNDISCCAIQPGYCLPRLHSVGKDYELARRAKRVHACAVVRVHLFKLAARRQLRFRALLYPRKKIPCIVTVYTTIAKTLVSSIGSEVIVVYHRIQIQSTRDVFLKIGLRITLAGETLERCCRGA